MSQSNTYALPITPGAIIALAAAIAEEKNCPIAVVNNHPSESVVTTLAMDFCGAVQMVHVQLHPERADQTLAFFEGDPKLAEMLDMDGLTLTFQNFYHFLSVSGISEELLDLISDTVTLDDPSEVYMPSTHTLAANLAGRIMSIRAKDRSEIEKILGGPVTDLDSLTTLLVDMDQDKYVAVANATSAAEYDAVNGAARRLANEIARSNDLVREICAAVITHNTPHNFTAGSWAQKECWAAISGTTDEVKDLLTEIIERSKDGSLKPEWTAEHVPYFTKGESATEQPDATKANETSPEKAAVLDSVWMMAGIGAGIVVASVVTLAILRKIRS